MSAKDAHLYRPASSPPSKRRKELTTSNSLTFASHLSSLISTNTSRSSSIQDPSKPTRTSARPSKSKPDLFASRNRQQLAPRHARGPTTTTTTTTTSDGPDADTLARSRRKLEAKARLYAQLRRGDVSDGEGRHMVDFDAKWAAAEERRRQRRRGAGGGGGGGEYEDGEEGRGRFDDSDSEEPDSEDEGQAGEGEGGDAVVEWTDEFGRTITGTVRERARAEARARLGREVEEERRGGFGGSAPPAGLIVGDAVQSAAFNPERDVAERMAALARKRDRSLTPPEETHYDADGEVRSRGVGFMKFGKGEGEREGQMRGLEREREETETRRRERDALLEKRKGELEERRRRIGEVRAGKKADEFLEGLAKERDGKSRGEGANG